MCGIVFSDLLEHNKVAFSLGGMIYDIIGAGFCYINADNEYTCYGESVSLKVKSGENDSKELNRVLGVSE